MTLDTMDQTAPAASALGPALRTLLISEWYLPVIGGSVNYFVNTYTLYPEGSVQVLTGLADPNAKGIESPLPVTRVSLQRYKYLRPESLAMYVRLMRAADDLVRREQIQMIHCGHVLPEALVAYAMKKKHGIPYVVYCHGEEVSVQANDPAKRKLMPFLFNRADGIIANSSNSRNILLGVGVRPEQITVVNPGVDIDRFHPGQREPDGLVRLLSVGRLQPRKGHERVLRAVAKLRDDLPQLRYDIAGDGDDGPMLRELTRELGLGDVVNFVGEIDDDQLTRLYQECDVFVLANRKLSNDDQEGFGMVFLEAASCGKPVIGGNTGGTSDAVDHEGNGLLVDTADVDVLAQAIRRLVDDAHLRATMGERGRQRAVDKFQWRDISRRIRALGVS